MTHRRVHLKTMLGGFAATVLLQLSLPALAADVCFYEHYNYQGASFCTSATSGEVGAAVADHISSVRVPTGTRLTLYQHPNFTGATLELSADVANLTSQAFNNKTSSFRIAVAPPPAPPTLPPTAGALCFFEDYDYRGQSECVTASSGRIQAITGRVSSVKVPAGAHVSLYETIGFAGRTLKLSGDTPNLSTSGFNNLTSSYQLDKTGTPPSTAIQIVFIGNSFTHGNADPVLHYNAVHVTDLNGSGYGGMPGIFKQLTVEAGLNYQVTIEAVSAQTLKYHYTSKQAVLGGRRWDVVVMHDQSNLDPAAPGNPANLITYSAKLEKFFHAEAGANANANAKVWLLATWPRPDQIYPASGHWFGQTLEQAAAVLSNGYKAAAAQDRAMAGVIPVGDAFVLAVAQGVADRNPYDGIDGDKLNIWAGDNHHASAAGSYLEALVVFGRVTGIDPRSLGGGSVAARAMNLTAQQTTELQAIAYRQLSATPAP